MAKIKFSLILLIAFITYSCDKTETMVENPETMVEDIFFSKNPDPTNDTFVNDNLENKMQWVSYMTAQVLLNNREARDQFQNEIDNSGGTNVFPLENLLGWNVIDQSFKNAFKDEFLLNYYEDYLCDDIGKPSGRITPPPVGSFPSDADYDTVLFEGYLATLIDEECFEFYAPNGFTTLPINVANNSNAPIKSTAHPLNNNATSNEGFKHTNFCFINHTTIDDNTLGSVILIRPYRMDSACDYSEYPFDFTGFLN